MNKIQQYLRDREEMFEKIQFVTENSLICPICNISYPSGTFSFDLSCRTADCDGIVETPSVRYQREVKSFHSETIKGLLQMLVDQNSKIGAGLSVNPDDNSEYEKGYYGAIEDINNSLLEINR